MKGLYIRGFLAVVLLASMASSAFALQQTKPRQPLRLWVTGAGTATESDKPSADSEAYDAATTQANAFCAGTIDGDYLKTSDGCVKIGSDDNASYICSVTVKVMCVIPNLDSAHTH